MPVIIRDGKFVEDQFLAAGGGFIQLDQLSLSTHGLEPEHTGIDVPNDTNPEALAGLMNSVAAIRIPFPPLPTGGDFPLPTNFAAWVSMVCCAPRAMSLPTSIRWPCAPVLTKWKFPTNRRGASPRPSGRMRITRVSHNYLDRLKGAGTAA